MPLRPALYNRLKKLFKHVDIVNDGEEMVAHMRKDGVFGRPSLNIVRPGEYYRVNCPWCNDTRKRLYINYRWGLYDPDTDSLNLWLCNCFNEHCMRLYERQRDLYRDVFNDMFTEEDIVETGTDQSVLEESRPAFMPGKVMSVADLPLDHKAATYLTKRGFDLNLLTQFYNVGYCYEADENVAMANDRIFIPLYKESVFVGWQARYIGEPPNKFVPKYYSMPGWRKSSFLYNIDAAMKHKHVVIVEGPTDVWNYGPEAVCLFGKSASSAQLSLLSTHWQQHIILLDSDVKSPELARLEEGLLHYNKDNKIVIVSLPPNQDPGSMDPTYLRALVKSEASLKGVELN